MNAQLQARARLYALRILADWMGSRHEWRSLSNNDSFWALVGLEPPAEGEAVNLPAIVREARATAEAEYPGAGPPHPTVAGFSAALNLTPDETEVLEFALLAHYSPAFNPVEAADSELTRYDLFGAITTATGMERTAVLRALGPHSGLVLSGVVEEMTDYRDRIRSKLMLRGAVDLLVDDDPAVVEHVLDELTQRAPVAGLEMSAFDYMSDDAEMVRSILARALRERTAGTSILLYGEPGLGKSEFARAVVAAAGGVAYEPRDARNNHQRDPDNQRAREYAAAQRILSQRREAVLILDEMEDVFTENVSVYSVIRRSGRTNAKAWLTHTVESGPVPSIWIANTLIDVEPAVLRRFTYAIQFEQPPRETRRAIMVEQFRGLDVSEEWLEARATETRLPPAVTATTARAVRMAQLERQAEEIADRALAATRELLELPDPAEEAMFGGVYDLRFLNIDADLETLVGALRTTGVGRLCLYGPPGTGKSALAAHIAECIDRPLLRKTAAELISCFIGQTEKNIRRMFREAKRERAVLLLDEADGFLRDRRFAKHSWEVTEVNELLTRMERHEGVFICTTNLRDTLDPASIRRFDLKLLCDWLMPEQAVELASQHLSVAGHGWPDDHNAASALQARLGRISNLAPGDFVAVLRGVRLQGGLTGAEQLVRLLEAECAEKPDAPKQRAVGFV